MAKSEGTASGAARDEAQRDSVLDFLYHDARRVASFLAQFDPSGHLTGLKQSDTSSKSAGEEGTQQATASAAVAKWIGTTKEAKGEAHGEASERTYDPLWTNARTFLDYVTERGMLADDIEAARMGQFVRARGHLMILDLAMLKAAWDKPEIKRIVLSGGQTAAAGLNRQQRRAVGTTIPSDPNTDGMFALLTLLPHSLQARLIGDTYTVWCSLADEAVVGRSSDLVLKHGVLVAGDWNMVGVLDAFPYDPDHKTDEGQSLTEVLAQAAASAMGQLAARLAPVAQQLLGRPSNAYGMTPLMIFREVST